MAHIAERDGIASRSINQFQSKHCCCCHHVDEPTVKELVRGGAHSLEAVQSSRLVSMRQSPPRCRTFDYRNPGYPDPAAAAAATPPGGAMGRVALMRWWLEHCSRFSMALKAKLPS